MLVRFVVENFLSFKEATEFSMAAGKATRHSSHLAICNDKRILKGSCIFGANAGGKSNLLKAVEFAQQIVHLGVAKANCQQKYFRLDNESSKKPGIFQFDIYSGNRFYSYGFAISYLNSTIEEEWLYEIGDSEKCIFLRSKEEDGSFNVETKMVFSSEDQENRFNIYKTDISNIKMNQTLFLTDIATRVPDDDKEYRAFRDVYNWFSKLIVIYPNSKYDAITKLLDNENKKTNLEKLLKFFDTGITEVKKREVDFDQAFSDFPEGLRDSIKTDMANSIKENNDSAFIRKGNSLIELSYKGDTLIAKEVSTKHGKSADLFAIEDESMGTQRLFDLIPIYQALLEDYVVFIDEIDSSLHTKVVKEFINYYYEISEGHNSQLIVTTHDSNIMDLEDLRQDEIWFVEREKDYSSKLYSLNKFKTRFDKKVEKDYLLGRYGAIPIFDLSLLSNDDEREEADILNEK